MNTSARSVINKEVAVTSLYFRPGRDIKGYPKRMEYEGREYTFLESGLRCLIKKGQQLFEIFEMTDGTRDYRLKFDAAAQIWTLMGTREHTNAY
ncbi:MAG TPA: hypothetical protein VK983_00645 [Candidatus Limnocylindrales bacterium]|nr:hypothetical protein [Candidatus Limnocylindrales bacterium]